ncbi:MAG: RagB/SusD family nutrient uptake outer membrane protein [Pedobacter sp.]|uniref:RagB/SusD family nutrient uptake outer membrane protein n=1 Tax=Pedobacter sp. TaxID=1411316 RepID=UPI00280A212A|nr:RagB/SusD family nutrient uptake outer membrane protein [Pedobacter sp.]MDQ8006215.1 RagB/SusD family nutrient uptake outer membrane protein [Pedobacter sp.]
MKKIYQLLLLSLLFSACSLTEVLEVTPPNNLTPDNVAKNKEGAKNLLNGAYALLHAQHYYMHTELIPSTLGGTMRRATVPDIQFQDNNLNPQIANVNSFWTAFYKMINQTNWVVQLIGELPEGELTATERDQMLGQARALRAMATFDALRYFGQFYNLNSAYGVIVRTDAIDFTTRHTKRSTVAETYTQILSDLDYAITNAPDFTKSTLFSKTAAKALKARVLLFRGEYASAATLADEVILENKRSLSPTFARVFADGFTSTEMIFMRATDAVTFVADRKKFTYTNNATIVSPWLKTFMTGDPRVAASFNATSNNIIKVNNAAAFAPTYFIRLVEMYLIKAEGLTRSDAPLADAKIPLQTIMSRAWGAPRVSAATTKAALLDEIHAEYIKELCFENGSDWFANIRFGKISAIKPTVTNVNQYILPIPESETVGNNLFGRQNPGYE